MCMLQLQGTYCLTGAQQGLTSSAGLPPKCSGTNEMLI